MRDAIYNVAAEDPDLMVILSGGLWRADEVTEITKQGKTAAAFDSDGKIKPAALLRFESDIPVVFDKLRATRLVFAFFLYQSRGYDKITAARKRLYQLYHEQVIESEDESEGSWRTDYAGSVLDVEDTALKVPLSVVRFVALVAR